MIFKTAGSIDNEGKLTVFHREQLNEWIKAHANKDICLTIKTRGKRRSNKQNAYYWGVVVAMITERMKELGNEFDEERTHEFLKHRFNYEQIEVKDGLYIDVGKSTTDMDTKDFMLFIEKVQQFAADLLDIYIPDPNEQTELNF